MPAAKPHPPSGQCLGPMTYSQMHSQTYSHLSPRQLASQSQRRGRAQGRWRCLRTGRRAGGVFLSLAVLTLAPGLLISAALAAPWWENYGVVERFACGGRNSNLSLRRNDNQASLEGVGSGLTLFRDRSVTAGEHYDNGRFSIELRGDLLTFKHSYGKSTCRRVKST